MLASYKASVSIIKSLICMYYVNFIVVERLKPFKEVAPKAWKLLGDETRRNMIFLLRVKELTVSQISAQLDMTPQAIYHHIKKLEKAGLVEVSREDRLGRIK